MDSGSGLPTPSLQYHFCASSPSTAAPTSLIPGFQMQIDQLRPYSRGSVSLASANPDAPPIAQFNYFSDRRDLDELVDGFRQATDVLHQTAFDKYRGAAALPGGFGPDPRAASDDELRNWIQHNSGTDYHPCGTCRMGGREDDHMAVVDEKMRVRGVDNLHVIDASVMPRIVSGNLNAPVQMIAMKAADILMGRKRMKAERPAFHFDGKCVRGVGERERSADER